MTTSYHGVCICVDLADLGSVKTHGEDPLSACSVWGGNMFVFCGFFSQGTDAAQIPNRCTPEEFQATAAFVARFP